MSDGHNKGCDERKDKRFERKAVKGRPGLYEMKYTVESSHVGNKKKGKYVVVTMELRVEVWYCGLYRERNKCRGNKEDAQDDRRTKEEKLCAATLME